MSDWKEHTGSYEQIAEMQNAPHGWIVEYIDTDEPVCTAISQVCFLAPQDTEVIQKYLICNPHPYADMARQQLLTGHPVWVKMKSSTYWAIAMRGFDLIYQDHVVSVIKSTTPDWNIPGAEYSLSEFKEEV